MMDTNQAPSGRSEIIKFLLLIGVMAVTVGVVSWSRPLIFNRIVPAVMGEEETSDEAIEDTAVDEPAEAPAEMDNEQAVEEETAVDESEPVDEAVETVDEEAVEGTGTETAVDEPITHVVQAGETVFAIARRYGVTATAIVEANELSNPNRVNVGQTLIIPQP